jgi:hypothetical protein
MSGLPKKSSSKSKYKKSKTSSKKVNKPKLNRIVALTEIFCSIGKEHPNVFPTRLGWCQKHGARRMGLSTQRKRASLKFNSLNKSHNFATRDCGVC